MENTTTLPHSFPFRFGIAHKLEALRTWCIAHEQQILLSLLCVQLFQALTAIYNFGYIGQDWGMHTSKILSFQHGFSYRETTPPLLYRIGDIALRRISARYVWELTSLVIALSGIASLWVAYKITKDLFTTASMRLAAMALITFLPVRVVHSIVIASDGLTVLPYFLMAFFAIRLVQFPLGIKAFFANWFGLSFSLLAGLYAKYTFIFLFAPVLVIMCYQFRYQSPKGEAIKRLLIVILLLLAPLGLTIHMKREMSKSGTYNHWKPKGTESAMNFQDLFLLKANDIGVFKFETGDIQRNHYYSYGALLHFCSFTDCLNILGRPVGSVNLNSADREQKREHYLQQNLTTNLLRWRTGVMLASLIIGVLALLALPYYAWKSILFLLHNIRESKLPVSAVILTLFSLSLFLPYFFSLPFVHSPYGCGYYRPRLILASVVTFVLLSVKLVEQWFQSKPSTWRFTFSSYFMMLAVSYYVLCSYLWWSET